MAKNDRAMRNLRLLDGRWVSGIDADAPVVDAGPAVVDLRLREVQPRVERALRDHSQSAEHVHQLRVATRRADAALRAFRGIFDPTRW
jgi:hypothetical protein